MRTPYMGIVLLAGIFIGWHIFPGGAYAQNDYADVSGYWALELALTYSQGNPECICGPTCNNSLLGQSGAYSFTVTQSQGVFSSDSLLPASLNGTVLGSEVVFIITGDNEDGTYDAVEFTGLLFGGSIVGTFEGHDSVYNCQWGGDFTVDITAHLYSISGTIFGDVREGVSVHLNGPAEKVVRTGEEGTYLFEVPEPGAYTVTPVQGRVTFEPSSSVVEITGDDVTGVDFTSLAPLQIIDASAVPFEAPDNNTEILFSARVVSYQDATVGSVTLDLGPVGGADNQHMFDDGTNGDATAGDSIYSYHTTVAMDTPPGLKAMTVRAVDAAGNKAEATITIKVICRMVVTVVDEAGTTVENEIEGQTLEISISLLEAAIAKGVRNDTGGGVLLAILKPDGTVFQENISVTEEKQEITIKNAAAGAWTLRVRNTSAQPRTYDVSSTTSGTGVLLGVVVDAETGDPLGNITVSTSGGGSTVSDEGYYVMIHLAGVFRVSAQAAGYQGASSSVSVASGQTTMVDLALIARQEDDEPICPLTHGASLADRDLSLLRSFRDVILNKKAAGRRYRNLYYAYGAKVNSMLQRDPALLKDVRACITSIIPLVRDMVRGKQGMLEQHHKESISTCLQKISARVDDELRFELHRIEKLMDTGMLLSVLNQ